MNELRKICPNLHIRCSPSGKTDKNLIKDWFQNVLYPNIGQHSLILLDALPAYKDHENYDHNVTQHKNLKIMIIPKRCTGKFVSYSIMETF